MHLSSFDAIKRHAASFLNAFISTSDAGLCSYRENPSPTDPDYLTFTAMASRLLLRLVESAAVTGNRDLGRVPRYSRHFERPAGLAPTHFLPT